MSIAEGVVAYFWIVGIICYWIYSIIIYKASAPNILTSRKSNTNKTDKIVDDIVLFELVDGHNDK